MTATPADAAASPAPSTAFDPSAPVPEEYDVFCHACGYSLLGLLGDRCPECGAAFKPGEMPYARVPWLHRRRVGLWRAYWQTVRMVVLRPTPLAEELCRPVRISADDARRFRRFTIHLAVTSALAAALAVAWVGGEMQSLWRWGNAGDWAAFALLVALGWFGGVFFLNMATDMPLFIWKGLPSLPPSELAPLHHYAAAPLALVPGVVFVAAVIPAVVSSARMPAEWLHTSGIFAAVAVVAWLFVAWRTPPVLMKAATGCDNRRAAVLALYLPAHCAIMALLTVLLAATAGMVISETWKLIVGG